MARSSLSLSENIAKLSNVFEPHRSIAAEAHIEISGLGVRTILSTLRTLRHLAILQEREIGALREMELARVLAKAVSAELVDLVETGSGDNVVRPDFGSKS